MQMRAGLVYGVHTDLNAGPNYCEDKFILMHD